MAWQLSNPGWNYSLQWAKPFNPNIYYQCRTEFIEEPELPIILVSNVALAKMFTLVTSIDIEVGWLGVAKKEGKIIYLEDIFLFDQDVSAGHTELSIESMSKMIQEILKEPNGEEMFNNIRFWGHSHGHGGTHPSSTDDSTVKNFRDFGSDFFLRGICNRSGEINFSLYNWDENIVFHHVRWEPYGDPLKKEEYSILWRRLRLEMRMKIKTHNSRWNTWKRSVGGITPSTFKPWM